MSAMQTNNLLLSKLSSILYLQRENEELKKVVAEFNARRAENKGEWSSQNMRVQFYSHSMSIIRTKNHF